MKNIYILIKHIILITMFDKFKAKMIEKKQKRIEKKTGKLDMKMSKVGMTKEQKKQAKISKKKDKLNARVDKKSVKKHITALPFVGSKVLQGFAGFAAAGAFYQYEAHNMVLTGVFAGATFAIALVSAAPYMKSISRTNKTLEAVQVSLDKIDSFVGSNQQFISAIVSDVEKGLQNSGYAPDQIKQLHVKIDNLQRSIDAKNAPDAPKPDVHTAPQKKKINVE